MNKTIKQMPSYNSNHRFKIALILAFIFSIALSIPSVFAQDPAPADAPVAAGGGSDDALVSKGEAVFKANCAQCHAFKDVVVGPALEGAVSRWPSEQALAEFIKYPQKVIDGGKSKHAKELYDKFKQYMPNHDFLAAEEIQGVIAYIKAGPKESGPAVPPTNGENVAQTNDTAADQSTGSYLYYVLGGLLIVLLLIVIVLILLISVLTKYLSGKSDIPESDKELIEQKLNLGSVFKSSAFKGIVTFIFVIVLLKVTYDQVYGIGIQKGYAPKQPIAFSHKLHAGMYEIDCNYCHTGVYKGKSATIPSVNICLNCHNSIKTNSPEIKKLWKAVETDKPIEWVRVHNLPDLAYFNHAQHTNVGGIECQTCHGDIKEMEVVMQYSSLTMGWCINCHKETVVKTDGNAYYDKLVKMHNKTSGDPLKVVNIGGLECSKCHY